MLGDMKLKLWQSVLIAFLIVAVLAVVAFSLLPGNQGSLLAPVAS